MRLLRSVLYMPASNGRALDKARSIPADALIFDLEDAVAPDAKSAARDNAVAACRSGNYGERVVTIRCNGLGTPWGDADLAAAATSGAHAVVIPKVDSAGYLDEISHRLDAAEAPTDLVIWAMIETPTAVLDARLIAAHPRVDALVVGANDLAKELRCGPLPDRAALVPALAMVVLAGREAGTIILDGVYNDIHDSDGFTAEARHGKAMGFDGKTLIHPSQVEPTNVVWTPTDNEIDHARRVIAAFDEATQAGKGVVTVDGRMVENMHVEIARRTLDIGR